MQNISVFDCNIFGGIVSCGEPFLGSKFSISSHVIVFNEKYIVLLADDLILRILGWVSKHSTFAKLVLSCDLSKARIRV